MSGTILLLRPICFHGMGCDKFPCLPKLTVQNKTHITNSFLRSCHSSAGREISRTVWKPKALCRVHKRLFLSSILSQLNPVHATPHILFLEAVVILPSHLFLGLPNSFLLSGLQTKPCMNFLYFVDRASRRNSG